MAVSEEEWRARVDGIQRMNKHCQDEIDRLTREHDGLLKTIEAWERKAHELADQRDSYKCTIDVLQAQFDGAIAEAEKAAALAQAAQRERDEARRALEEIAKVPPLIDCEPPFAMISYDVIERARAALRAISTGNSNED